MERKQALAFKLAREDGQAFPNSLHFLLANVIENGREARESMEALLAECREACESVKDPPRTAGKREIRDRETS